MNDSSMLDSATFRAIAGTILDRDAPCVIPPPPAFGTLCRVTARPLGDLRRLPRRHARVRF